ncbi:hypothetical protein ACJX0J_011704, partial [Zea mays]
NIFMEDDEISMIHNNDKVVIEHKKMVEAIAAGIDNECPALVSKPCVATFSLFNIYKCEDPILVKIIHRSISHLEDFADRSISHLAEWHNYCNMYYANFVCLFMLKICLLSLNCQYKN